jgi:hypothetical protein
LPDRGEETVGHFLRTLQGGRIALIDQGRHAIQHDAHVSGKPFADAAPK